VVPAQSLQLKTLTNSATVIGTIDDTNLSNNSASVVTAIRFPDYDLGVNQSDSPDPADLGTAVTYQIVVSNNGPDNAASVSLNDVLPNNTSFVSAVPSQGTYVHIGNQVLCSLGTLAAGQTATVAIAVVPNGVGKITNTATVLVAIFPDRDATNNTAVETTTIRRSGD